MQRIRVERDRWERSRDGEVYHHGDEVVATDSEVAFLGDQATTLEYVSEIDTEPSGSRVDELLVMSHDELKQRYRDLGGDPDSVDMRKTDSVIEGILALEDNA